MERRAASHTEEEEMNQRRRLLGAAKKGDQKAAAKLFELYQVRVYNHEMVNKLNRTAGTHKLQAQLAQGMTGSSGKHKKGSPAIAAHRPAKSAAKRVAAQKTASATRAAQKKGKR